MCLRFDRHLLTAITSAVFGSALILVPTMVAWAAVPVAYPPHKVVVQISPRSIAVLFPEKVGLWLTKKDGFVTGIRRIVIGQHEILGSCRGAKTPVASLIAGGKIRSVRDWAAYVRRRGKFKVPPGRQFDGVATPASFKFQDFPHRGGLRIEKVPLAGRYLGWRDEGKWVCVRVGLNHGEVDWLIAPTKVRIEHALYRGVQWKLRMRGHEADKIFSLDVDQPFAVRTGDWHFTQKWFGFSEVHLNPTGAYRLDWNPGIMPWPDYYFAGRQPFFFTAGRTGVTASYFAKVVPVREVERQQAGRLIVHLHIPVRPRNGALETPPLKWLFHAGNFSGRWAALNAWTRVFDFTGHYYRSLMGIKHVDPLPTIFAFGKDPGGGEHFDKIAKLLPTVARFGLKAIFLPVLENTEDKSPRDYLAGSENVPNIYAIWRTKISPSFGGEVKLRHLCDMAHRLGMKVITWSATSDFANSSPLLWKHPNWIAWNAKGAPVNLGYHDVTAVNFRRGALDYVIQQYRKIRAATGLDGMWQDSFINFGILTDFSEPHPYPQLNQTVKLVREEQAMGCRYVISEGYGPFALSSGGEGFGDLATFKRIIRGKEYGLYYEQAATVLRPHSYYRTLASKGGVWFELTYLGKITNFGGAYLNGLPPAVQAFIVQVNHDYNVVLPYMKKRHLIGVGKKWLGVEWLDDDKPRVLFAFTPMPWQVPPGAKIRDVTTGREYTVTTGVFPSQAWHTYLLQ